MSEISYDKKYKLIEVTSDLGINMSSTNPRLKHTGTGTFAISSTAGPITLETTNTTSGITIGATPNVPVNIGSGGGTITLGNSELGDDAGDTMIDGDLTVTGNLTVTGTTVSQEVVSVQTEDPILRLNEGTTGANTSDIGFVGDRGSTGNPIGFIWDESADTFSCATFATGSLDSTTITITDYVDLRCGALTVDDAATVGSTLGVTGNLSVNTSKFTVAASTGNTVVAGTLGVTGATTMSSNLTFDDDTPTITSATDGDAQDFTISLTGANNSSLVLTSEGTGADAIKINASNAAGGIDVDCGTNGFNLFAAGGSIDLTSLENASGAISLHANGGESETVYLRSEQGTSASSINIVSDVGGITLNSNSPVAVTNNATIGGTLDVSGVTNINASSSTSVFTVTNTYDAGSLEIAKFQGDSGDPSSDDDAYITLAISNSVGTQKDAAQLQWGGDFLTGVSNNADLKINVLADDTMTTAMTFDGSSTNITTSWSFDVTGLSTLSGGVHLEDTVQLILGDDNDMVISFVSGNPTFDNTHMSSSTIFRLGTDTSATSFEIQNNSEDVLFEVDGTGTTTINTAESTASLTVTSTSGDASVEIVKFEGASSSIAAGDEAYMTFTLRNAGNNPTDTSRITWKGNVLDNGPAEDADLIFSTLSDSSLVNVLTLDGSAQSVLSAWGVDITGTLDVSGDVSVNTNKFTITASSGNTTVGGTLVVTGATTLNSTLTVGQDDTGYDVRFYGATSGSSMLWDESLNKLVVTGTDSSNALEVTGNVIINNDSATDGFVVTSTSDNASVEVAKFVSSNNGTISTNDEAYMTMTLRNTGGTLHDVGRIKWKGALLDNGASEDADLIFATFSDEALVDVLTLDGSAQSVVSAWGVDITGTLDVSGVATLASNLDCEGYAAIGNGSALSADNGLIIDYDTTYTGVGSQLLVKGTVTGAASTNVYGASITPESITVPTGTTTVAASLHLKEPVLTATGTVTNAATLYIEDAPTEGSSNYALYVASGQTNLQGITDVTASNNGSVFTVTNTYDASDVEIAKFQGNSTGPTSFDKAHVSFALNNGSDTQFDVAKISWQGADLFPSSETGDLIFSTLSNTTMTDVLTIDGSDQRVRCAWDIDCQGTMAVGDASNPNANYALIVDYDATYTTEGAQLLVKGSGTAATATNAFGAIFDPDSITIASGTSSVVASVKITEPNIIISSGAVTTAASLYVEAAPTEASSNYAIWCQSGANLLGGATTLGSTLTVTGVTTLSSNLDCEGYAAIGNGSALSADNGLIIDYDATYTGVGSQLLVKGTVSGAASTNVYGASIQPESITVPTGTTAVAASLHLKEPVLTATGTVTNAATLYIEDAPTEGGTGNYALYVASGQTNLQGITEITTSSANSVFTVTNTYDDNDVEIAKFQGNSTGPTSFDKAHITFALNNGSDVQKDVARIGWEGANLVDSAEYGDIVFYAMTNATMTEVLRLDSSAGEVRSAWDIDCRGVMAIGDASGPTPNYGLIIDYNTTYTTEGSQLLVKGEVTAAAGSDVYGALFDPDLITIPSGTTDVVATVRISDPNIAITSGSVTTAATLYVDTAPTEGDSNYAIWSEAGANLFGGATTCGSTLGVTGDTTLASDLIFTNDTPTITSATAGTAEDFTISLTGATNSSLVLSSEGTGSDAIKINASAGGLDIDAAGSVNIDAGATGVNITSTAGPVNITSTEDSIQAIYLHANGGTSESIYIHSDQGTNVMSGGSTNASIQLYSDVGGIGLKSTANLANSIFIEADGGTSESIYIHSDQGTGVGVNGSIKVSSDVGGVYISSGIADSDAIVIDALNAAGGINIDSGTGGIDIDTDGNFDVVSQAASSTAIRMYALSGGMTVNLGSNGLNMDATGSLNMNSALASSSAIVLDASNASGGINIDSGTGGFDLDTDGSINLTTTQSSSTAIVLNTSDAAGGIDVNCGTNGFDLDTTGPIELTSTENASNCIYILANGGSSETVQIRSVQGTGATSVNVVSDAGGITLNANDEVAITNGATVGGRLDMTGTINYGGQLVTGPITTTLDDTDGNIQFVSTSAGAVNITLPAESLGRWYRFILYSAGAFACNISSDGAGGMSVLYNNNGTITAAASQDTISFDASAASIGDFIEVYSGSSLSWYAYGVSSDSSGISHS